MKLSNSSASLVYDLVLSHGYAGRDRFYDALRRVGLPATPADRPGFLFAPNPVIVDRAIIAHIESDLEVFCQSRLEKTPDPASLRATMPKEFREAFGGVEVAAKIHENLLRSAPFTCLDCFLVEAETGLEPAYLEWQTFPAYAATSVFTLEAIHQSFPGLEEVGATFSPIAGESLSSLRERIRHYIVRGADDDPRRVVLIDFEPNEQETAFEFDLQVAMTGGAGHGIGVIDPREVEFHEGRPCYRRDGTLIPISVAHSRLVHGDIAEKLWPACGPQERANLTRLFNDTTHIDWRVHPLHFLYGTKGDFPGFRSEKLSAFIPGCEPVTTELIEAAQASGVERLHNRVQKPVEGHGGRDVLENPRVSELELGALLQERIHPAACHSTLDGDMTPELRVMAIPDDTGRLTCAGVFTRVKAPTEFRSNAGEIARRNIPGTGEGYALIVDENEANPTDRDSSIGVETEGI